MRLNTPEVNVMVVRIAPILEVLGNALDALSPARVDVFVPCECLSQIEEQLVPIIAEHWPHRVELTGSIEFEDITAAHKWGKCIERTAAFQDFVSHLNERHKDEIVYAQHDPELSIVRPVKNPFIAITNQEKIAKSIYEAMQKAPDNPIPRIIARAKELVSLSMDKSYIASTVGERLSEIIWMVMDTTGLSFNEIISEIKQQNHQG